MWTTVINVAQSADFHLPGSCHPLIQPCKSIHCSLHLWIRISDIHVHVPFLVLLLSFRSLKCADQPWGMYALYKQLHPPTGVEYSVCCNFFDHSEKNLVTAGVNQIQVYRLCSEVEVRGLHSAWYLFCLASSNQFLELDLISSHLQNQQRKMVPHHQVSPGVILLWGHLFLFNLRRIRCSAYRDGWVLKCTRIFFSIWNLSAETVKLNGFGWL